MSRSLGRTIRALRLSAGLTLEALAIRAGVCRATLTGLEAGTNTNPRIATLSAIASSLGVTPQALLGLASKSVAAGRGEIAPGKGRRRRPANSASSIRRKSV